MKIRYCVSLLLLCAATIFSKSTTVKAEDKYYKFLEKYFTIEEKYKSKWGQQDGFTYLVLCQDLVQVKMSFSHSNLPAIPKLPVDTILQNHRVTYNRNDYEFVWYYKTFPSIQIPGGMHVCNC